MFNFEDVKAKYEKLKKDYRLVVSVYEGSPTTVSIQFWKRLYFNGEEYFSKPWSCFHGNEINKELTIEYVVPTFEEGLEDARLIEDKLGAEISIVRWYD